MEIEDVTEIEIRDAIYTHVCQLLIAGIEKNLAFLTAIETYERAYGSKIGFRERLLKHNEHNK